MNALVALVASLVVLCGDSFAVAPSKPRDRTAPRADELNAFQLKALTGLNFQDHIIYKTVNGESL